MSKSLIFAKRNLIEMVRDPLLYIFCAGFPIALCLMFQIILKYSGGHTPVFEVKSLIPGLMMFSYSLLMLMSSLLVSKDKTTAFVKRLFTSPMKTKDYLIGYFIPYILIGIVQSIICIILGYIFGATSGTGFVSFGRALLLILEMLPIMMINIMIGMIFGTILNDKSAPAFSSIFISSSGVLGGAWMPIDTMGDFEKFAQFLPFYPPVYLGRIITGANHTLPDNMGNPVIYTLGDNGWIHILVLSLYFVGVLALTLLFFNKKLKSDK